MVCLTCKRPFHQPVSEQFEARWMGLHVHRLVVGSDVTVAFSIFWKILVSCSLFPYVMRPKITVY